MFYIKYILGHINENKLHLPLFFKYYSWFVAFYLSGMSTLQILSHLILYQEQAPCFIGEVIGCVRVMATSASSLCSQQV